MAPGVKTPVNTNRTSHPILMKDSKNDGRKPDKNWIRYQKTLIGICKFAVLIFKFAVQ